LAPLDGAEITPFRELCNPIAKFHRRDVITAPRRAKKGADALFARVPTTPITNAAGFIPPKRLFERTARLSPRDKSNERVKDGGITREVDLSIVRTFAKLAARFLRCASSQSRMQRFIMLMSVIPMYYALFACCNLSSIRVNQGLIIY